MFRKVQTVVLCAFALSALSAAPASADTTYPLGGSSPSTFDSDTQGWSSASTGCTLLVIPSILCTVTNEWTGSRGASTIGTAETGALSARYTSAVGLLGLLTGTSTWRSPDFTVQPGANSTAVLSFKRATEVQALLDVGGQAATQVVLHDVAANTRTDLFTDPVTTDNGNFEPEGVGVPASLLKQGGTYALEFVTTFTSTTLQALNGTVSVFYDDIGLKVPDGTDTGNVAPSVSSLNASDLTGDAATLNGLVNPKGLETTTGFEYGPTTAYGLSASLGSVGNGTTNVPITTRVAGLTKCTTYHFRALGENIQGVGRGEDLTFTTDCAPSVTTLPASATGATGAVLNGSVTPNGPESAYAYQFGKTTEYGSSTPTRTAGSGREARQPLSEAISGLEPETTYHARIVAFNALGATLGGDVTFTTPPLTGPAGANGAPGTPGAPGAPGRPGRTTGSNTTLNSGDARALLIIRSATARVGLRGKRSGQIRLPIFCKKETGRSCAGTVKIRTREKINPSSKPGVKKKARLVTLATFEYQLQAGRKGFAIATIQPEKLDLMRLRKRVKVNLSVQVTDSNNNRQTIVRRGVMIAQRTV